MPTQEAQTKQLADQWREHNGSRQRQTDLSSYFRKRPLSQAHRMRKLAIKRTRSGSSDSQLLLQSKRKEPRQKASNSQQLYLDLGQENFSERSICKYCGMLTVHGLREDEDAHKRVCDDYRLGVQLHKKHLELLSPMGIHQENCIVQARLSDVKLSSSLVQKLSQIQDIVNCDLGSTDAHSLMNISHDTICYLYVSKNNRVVGWLATHQISEAHRVECDSVDNLTRSNDTVKACLGIYQIWVHSNTRRQGVATRLLRVARERAVFGWTVPMDQVAISNPSSAGVHWMKTVSPDTGTILVYSSPPA